MGNTSLTEKEDAKGVKNEFKTISEPAEGV